MLVACGPEDRLERVRELQARGRFQESLEPLRELLAARPDDAEVHYRYGAALRHSGQSGMALWSLRKASEHPDWVVSAGLELAAVAIQVQIWETAIEASGRVLAVDPENVEAWVLRAEARLSQKSDPAAALADFDRALELDPGNFGVQASRAAALLSLDRIDEAGAAIADLEDLGREAHLGKGVLGRLCVTRAIFASERRELDEAEALFSDCLERFPIHGTVLEEATDFFDERGRPEHATQILRAVLVEAPRAVDYRIALAGRLRAAGEFEEAEQVLRAGLELEDAALVADAWAALADHFVAVDDLQAAASAYERSFDLVRDPSALQVLTLADVLARAGQDERALEVARRLDNDAYRGLVTTPGPATTRRARRSRSATSTGRSRSIASRSGPARSSRMPDCAWHACTRRKGPTTGPGWRRYTITGPTPAMRRGRCCSFGWRAGPGTSPACARSCPRSARHPCGGAPSRSARTPSPTLAARRSPSRASAAPREST
jgi:tetratricopeptide (TPR) repeat protein